MTLGIASGGASAFLRALAVPSLARVRRAWADGFAATVIEFAARATIRGAVATLGRLPKSSPARAYTIRGIDGSPYLDRVLLPCVLGHRVVLHRIRRADAELWLHDHPWRTARFLILSGGYDEERMTPYLDRHGRRTRFTRSLRRGDVNRVDLGELHRITRVLPGTCTVGLIGKRCTAWGFLVDDRDLVPAPVYFARVGYASQGGDS